MKSPFRIALCALVTMFVAGAVATTPAFASGKPVAETEPATELKETEVKLKGTVNPEGLATTYYFEWATEKGEFTHKTTETSAGSGELNLKKSEPISGLAPNMTHHTPRKAHA